MDYIENKNGNCQLILRKYKSKNVNSKNSIIIPGVYESINDDEFLCNDNIKNMKWFIKKSIKMVLPYYVVRKIQQSRENKN